MLRTEYSQALAIYGIGDRALMRLLKDLSLRIAFFVSILLSNCMMTSEIMKVCQRNQQSKQVMIAGREKEKK
jgi:hypothetical protein